MLERRSRFRLEKIAARLEVLEGYLAVYLNLDKVIKIIRTEDEPKPKLMKAFRLTDNQAEAILNMRLRALRKLEEMEIRGEHASLTKEQKELTKLLGSEKLKSEKLIEQVKEIDAKFGGKTATGQAPHRNRRRPRRGGIVRPGGRGGGAGERGGERAHHHRLFAEIVATRRSRAIRKRTTPIKYREGDGHRFWIHAQTTDRLMMLATDGRFFTLDCSKLPGGRGNGEAIRTFIDLPPEADIATMFVHVPGRKLLLAPTSGHGFITNEDDAIAMTKNGKRVMNVKPGVEARGGAGSLRR